MPWLEDSDMPAARAWAELEYLCGSVYAEIREHGMPTPQGNVREVLDAYRRLRATQATLSRELGMTPSARMALSRRPAPTRRWTSQRLAASPKN
jgi:phage terminase small subunit